jgi:hypothetical protein
MEKTYHLPAGQRTYRAWQPYGVPSERPERAARTSISKFLNFFIFKLSLALSLSIINCQLSIADEGMWLPSQIENQVRDMRRKGFRLNASDLYSAEKPSLNDAIVLFGRGCTGAIVSPEGLLFTNHHCGYDQIVDHSTVEHDYLTNGFWAMNRGEELPNPGLEVRIMRRMENVTLAVEAGRRDEILAAATEGGRYEAVIKPLYHGNEQWMWVYEVFRDVRLVAAPPSAIGKFGGDTDNWIWPRHTGDFSVFRIYAGRDNKPADYSPQNQPYRPDKFFTIASDGAHEGDFTFVYGFPASTREYVTSDEVDYVVNRSNPMRIALRTLILDIIREASDNDPATRIAYASRQAHTANAWKKWQGESRGLTRRATVARKRSEEAEFRTWAASRPQYSHLLDSISAGYSRWANTLYVNELMRETFGMMEFEDNPVDKRINAALLEGFAKWWPRTENAPAIPTRFTHVVDSLGGYSSAANHPEALERLETEVWKALDIPRVSSFTSIPDIARLYTPYMRALREKSPSRNFYPDANFTLRIAYGSVAGYQYEDAVWHQPLTTIQGMIAKDNPNIYDYNVPTRLRELVSARDYGRWASSVNGTHTLPVCFIATNHTSGGNSGSPILNAHGHLLGLNFDRTWISTMSDIEFDPSICRNISVDVRYMLFTIEKIGNAQWLLNELKFSKKIPPTS